MSHTRRRILVIDDEPMLGQTLRFALEQHSDVVVLGTGRAALDFLASDSRFDLILCDLMMPTFSGVRVYEELSASNPDLLDRFAFITGGAFTDSARDFLDGYGGLRLEKPFHVADVEALLDSSEPARNERVSPYGETAWPGVGTSSSKTTWSNLTLSSRWEDAARS